MSKDSTIPTVKVSDKRVVPIRMEVDDRPVKGSDWFEKPFVNIGMIAQTKSGKTTVISNILKHCGGKNTKYLIITSTLERDDSWKSILKRIPDDMQFTETALITDEEKVDVLGEFLLNNKRSSDDTDKVEIKAEVKSRLQPVISNSLFTRITPVAIPQVETQTNKTSTDDEPKKPRRSKYLYPEWIIVLDDLGSSMFNSSSLEQLLKQNRHHKSMIIMAGQALNDLNPRQINMLNYMLLFRNIPEKKLREVYEKMSLYLPYEKFVSLYDDATSKQFGFLYITRDGEFRKGFTEKYVL